MVSLQKWALYLLVLALPFNGLPPPLGIGELSSEGFFYASIPYVGLWMLQLLRRPQLLLARPLLRNQGMYLTLIGLSLLLNLPLIVANAYGNRTGLERYAVSLLVIAYYFALGTALYGHARTVGIERFTDFLSRAFTVLAIGLTAVSLFEIASWTSEPLRASWLAMRAQVAETTSQTTQRLSGVSMEPSFNAFALLACIPWLHFRARADRSRWRQGHQLLCAILILLCLMSGARSAYVGLAAMAAAYILARGWLRRLLPGGGDGAVMVLVAFTLGIAVPIYAFLQIGPDETTSNVTRSYLMMGAIQSGWERLWGQGLGQVGFFVVQTASSAVQYSWELLDFFTGSRHGDLPPLFSWYARSFGEFGLVGYALLAVSFSLSIKTLFKLGHAAPDRFGQRLFMLTSLLVGQFLAIAFSIESIRMPQYWLGWTLVGLTVLYLRSAATARKP